VNKKLWKCEEAAGVVVIKVGRRGSRNRDCVCLRLKKVGRSQGEVKVVASSCERSEE
jgi:hypothetical protein